MKTYKDNILDKAKYKSLKEDKKAKLRARKKA